MATKHRYYDEKEHPDVAFGSPGLEKNRAAELLPAYTEAGVIWWLECSS
jgi:hypothetical protein